MKIEHLDGEKLYYAFFYGKKEVLKKKKHLNKINVFPVRDGDTGTNLSLTMQSIFDSAIISPSVADVSRGMAEAALTGSRGNSGIIFAQFVQGLSEAVKGKRILNRKDFSSAMRKGVEYAYRALSKPVEGTILTVMKAWAHSLHTLHDKSSDFLDLLSQSMEAARTSLHETPKKLKVLEEAGVVDAGAEGFVHFLEGIIHFIRYGEKPDLETRDIPEAMDIHVENGDQIIPHRYCTEGLLKGEQLDEVKIKGILSDYGDLIIVAGSSTKMKIHIHTNSPADLFYRLRGFGHMVQQKVDDMTRQQEVQFHRKSSLALVTDTSCDLPQEVLDKYQIHLVPLQIAFGESQYLDKMTLNPDQFYTMLQEAEEFPKTSQPTIKTFENLFSYLFDHYESVISFHLSKALSGTWNAAQQAAEKFQDKKIAVIDSRNLSISFGLMVLRVAQEIAKGRSFDEVVEFAESLRGKTKILVSVKTLKYLVRGGRVSPFKGFIARTLNLKPIVSLDDNGSPTLSGKAFCTRSNIRKILKKLQEHDRKAPVQSFAIGHAHAEKEAKKLERKVSDLLGKKAEFVMDISPVIGSHVGVGAMGVSFLSE